MNNVYVIFVNEDVIKKLLNAKEIKYQITVTPKASSTTERIHGVLDNHGKVIFEKFKKECNAEI